LSSFTRAKPDFISHTYTDHVSLSAESLDQLPNPVTGSQGPYVPVNRPAIGDMFDYFDFSAAHASGKPTVTGNEGARKNGAPVANAAPSLR
jgi:hypothetical protein